MSWCSEGVISIPTRTICLLLSIPFPSAIPHASIFSISPSLSVLDAAMLGGNDFGLRGRSRPGLGLPPPFRASPSSSGLVRSFLFLPIKLALPIRSTSTGGFVLVLQCSDSISHLPPISYPSLCSDFC